MMKKPENWDNLTPLTADYRQLPPGGYRCAIKGADVATNSKGHEMLKLALDIDEGEYKGYFAGKYSSRIQFNAEAKWPCVFYQNTGTDTNDEKTMSRLMGTLKAIEESNPGFKWNWDEKALVGKKVGVVFREEEYDFNGRNGFTTRPSYLTKTEGIEDAKVPPRKTLTGVKTSAGVDYADVPF